MNNPINYSHFVSITTPADLESEAFRSTITQLINDGVYFTNIGLQTSFVGEFPALWNSFYAIRDAIAYDLIEDLFEAPELQPIEVQEILANYDLENGIGYEGCKRLISELNAIGYSCDYGLDTEPYGLHKIESDDQEEPIVFVEISKRVAGMSSDDLTEILYTFGNDVVELVGDESRDELKQLLQKLVNSGAYKFPLDPYYVSEFAKLGMDKFGAEARVKITSNDDAATKWLTLNNESASALVAFLKSNFTITE